MPRYIVPSHTMQPNWIGEQRRALSKITIVIIRFSLMLTKIRSEQNLLFNAIRTQQKRNERGKRKKKNKKERGN